MKWLILLLILLAIGGYIAYRFRFAIMMIWQMWQMFKKVKDFDKELKNRMPKDEKSGNLNSTDQNLVRCSKCGKWTSQNEAMSLGNRIYYCSLECVNSSVKKV